MIGQKILANHSVVQTLLQKHNRAVAFLTTINKIYTFSVFLDILSWILAAMTLPQEDSGLFEKIDFLDLERDEAEKLVAKYNEEGEAYKKKMDEKYGSQKSSKRDSR